MGGTTSSANDWANYTRSAAPKSASYDDLYKNRSGMAGAGVKPEYDPLNIKVRESCASDANPFPTPIIISLDGTGSMDSVLAAGVKRVGDTFSEIYARKPVSDPHIMYMVHQDVAVGNRKPLQATQFESDTVLIDQIKDIFIEMGGGGNRSESYHLPLYFAATRTDCAAFKETPARKGYIFTIGDEGVPPPLTVDHIRTVFGNDEEVMGDMSYQDLLTMVQENYHVFHLMVTQTGMFQGYDKQFRQEWLEVLGQHAIPLDDINDLAEVIVATLQVVNGEDAATVAASFSGSTAITVATAVKSLTAVGDGGSNGVARL